MKRANTPLKAIILVGGEGTRLRPLTHDTPKPMVPVMNRPFLEHTIAYIKQYKIEDIILALGYLPESIRDYFKNKTNLGTQLTYSVESSPLGTAGAVKNVEQYLTSTFIVLNGDVFTELDIADMLAFHRQKKAKATIASVWVDNPSAFGVIETDIDGKVQRFIEKPPPDRVTTNWINAGTYILEPEVLEHVPTGSHYMFENGLFPLLVELGEPVYGYHFSDYWLDMGTLEKYLCLNYDLLLAKARSALIDGLNGNEICRNKDVITHPSAKITGPVLIDSGCRIGRGVHIKGPAIIGPDCSIGEGVIIESAVLWSGVSIGAGAVLKQCVIGSNTKIRNSTQVINRMVA